MMIAEKKEKNCTNCHYGIAVDPVDCPCIGKGGCFYQDGYKNWQPMTNGDKLRRLSDRELAARVLAWQGKKASFAEIHEWLKSEVEE